MVRRQGGDGDVAEHGLVCDLQGKQHRRGEPGLGCGVGKIAPGPVEPAPVQVSHGHAQLDERPGVVVVAVGMRVEDAFRLASRGQHVGIAGRIVDEDPPVQQHAGKTAVLPACVRPVPVGGTRAEDAQVQAWIRVRVLRLGPSREGRAAQAGPGDCGGHAQRA